VYGSKASDLEMRSSLLKRLWPAALGTLVVTLGVAAVSAQEPPRRFLWKVTSPSGAEAHLLGSIHVLSKAFYPIDPAIDRAFVASKVLVEEVNLDEMNDPTTMIALAAKAMLPEGKTLEQVVSKDTFAAITARATANSLPLMLIERMKPWMAAVTLTAAELTKAGFEPSLGIDKHYFDRAKAGSMPFRALETAAYQFDRLDGLSTLLQEEAVKAMLSDIDEQARNVETMATAWKRGDTAAIENLIDGFADAPELAERMLFERNRNWVPHVERCLTDNSRCFIVVGAAHLVGPKSLVELLRERKHRVEQQ
jgi:uncharacterized protein YbaP (TraB family)